MDKSLNFNSMCKVNQIVQNVSVQILMCYCVMLNSICQLVAEWHKLESKINENELTFHCSVSILYKSDLVAHDEFVIDLGLVLVTVI
jgi:hypothetical protein